MSTVPNVFPALHSASLLLSLHHYHALCKLDLGTPAATGDPSPLHLLWFAASLTNEIWPNFSAVSSNSRTIAIVGSPPRELYCRLYLRYFALLAKSNFFSHTNVYFFCFDLCVWTLKLKTGGQTMYKKTSPQSYGTQIKSSFSWVSLIGFRTTWPRSYAFRLA